MYKRNASLKEQAECILSLINTCTSIIEKFKYPDEDVRRVAFTNIRFISYSAGAITNLLDKWTEKEWREVIPQILGLRDVNEKSVNLMDDSLTKTSKLSLVLLSQFQIENFITRVSKAIGLPSASKGFYKKAENLITHLRLPKKTIEELNVLALIRNSLHSNGIHEDHRNTLTEVKIKHIKYKFIDGKKVSCATMEHIAHAIENSVKILEKILQHKMVKNHPGTIYDEYKLQQS